MPLEVTPVEKSVLAQSNLTSGENSGLLSHSGHDSLSLLFCLERNHCVSLYCQKPFSQEGNYVYAGNFASECGNLTHRVSRRWSFGPGKEIPLDFIQL